MKKLCTCFEPHYMVDYKNKLVYCNDCGAIIDPLEALKGLADHYGRIESRIKQMYEEAKEIQNYKPHLKIFKSLESDYQRDHFQMFAVMSRIVRSPLILQKYTNG